MKVLRRIDGKYDSLWQSLLGVTSTSGLLFCDQSPSSLVDETAWWEIYGNWGPFGGCVFRQMRGIQRQPLPVFAVFQVPTAQTNQYIKVAYFGVSCPELLWSYFGVTILLPFTIENMIGGGIWVSGSVWTGCVMEKSSLAYFCLQVLCHLVWVQNECMSWKGWNCENKCHTFASILRNDHFHFFQRCKQYIYIYIYIYIYL